MPMTTVCQLHVELTREELDHITAQIAYDDTVDTIEGYLRKRIRQDLHHSMQRALPPVGQERR